MKKVRSTRPTRRSLLRGFAAAAVTAAPTFSHAAGFLRGSGDIRRLRILCARSGEAVDTIYWVDGAYIPEALSEVDTVMRDWRTGEIRQIDPRTIDILAATHALLEVTEPYLLLSGYRCPKTNAKLRKGSDQVAKNSFHMKGMAADVRLVSRSVEQLAFAGTTCAAGGVGRYSSSGFVHLDSGPLRNWGR